MTATGLHPTRSTAEQYFAGLVGQEAVRDRLYHLWAEARSRFILLTGEEGYGKRSFARAFAAFCLAAGAADRGVPAGAADHGVVAWVQAGTHPDFIELQPEEKGKLIPVDRVRLEVTADVGMRPQAGRQKIYLINADALGEPSQNALLKTLEEPPSYCLFLLTAARPERLLPTILSRATEVRFAPYTDEELETILLAHVQVRPQLPFEPQIPSRLQQSAKSPAAAGGGTGESPRHTSPTVENLAFAVRFAGGSAGRALSLLADEDVAAILTAVNNFLFAVPGMRLTDCLVQGGKLFEDYKERADLILDLIELWLRDLLLAFHPELGDDLLLYRSRAAEFRAAAGQLTEPALLSLSASLQKVREARRYNGNFEIDTSYLLLRIYKELQNA